MLLTVLEDSRRWECRYRWSPMRARHSSWLRRDADPYPNLCRAFVRPTLARFRPAPQDHLGRWTRLSAPCPPFCRYCWPADNVASLSCRAWHATRCRETLPRSRRQISPTLRDLSAQPLPCRPQIPAASWLLADAFPLARLAPPVPPVDFAPPVCRYPVRNSSRTSPALRSRPLLASCFLLDFRYLDVQSAAKSLDRAFYRSNSRERRVLLKANRSERIGLLGLRRRLVCLLQSALCRRLYLRQFCPRR